MLAKALRIWRHTCYAFRAPNDQEAHMSKLTVQFTGRIGDDLGALAEEQGIPKTQVIRRAIALMKFIEDERAKGYKVSITDADDHVIKDIVST